MNASNDNLDIPFVPNTPQDIVLPNQRQPHQQQGQLVVIPAPDEQGVGMKDGGYGDPENDFTYVNVTEIDADEDGPLLEGGDLAISSDQKRGDVLAVLVGEMQQSGGSPLLVSFR